MYVRSNQGAGHGRAACDTAGRGTVRPSGRSRAAAHSLAGALVAWLVPMAAVPARAEAIIKIVDRKFPVGKFCPLESRGGAAFTFVATAPTMQLTFAANNYKSGVFNGVHLDNVSVQLTSTFDAHLVVTPGYEDCYETDVPPGQSGGGAPNAPSYDFNAASTPEASLDTFASSAGSWSGPHLVFDGLVRAPTTPATGGGLTGGSIALGTAADGPVSVSATKTLTGLMTSRAYVVFAWWHMETTDSLTIRVEPTCEDPDGDGHVDCSACGPAAGQTCGDCAPNNAHCHTTCTDGDGDGWCVDTDCNEAVPSCTNDCIDRLDLDATPDCRDGCIDTDNDGYGFAGGLGNTCLGFDCRPTNPYCNADCTDSDDDLRCANVDCDDNDPQVGPNLDEINDWIDQQCPGDAGHGVVDEISGVAGFNAAKNFFQWQGQEDADVYQVVRSTSRRFDAGCATVTTNGTSTPQTTLPRPARPSTTSCERRCRIREASARARAGSSARLSAASSRAAGTGRRRCRRIGGLPGPGLRGPGPRAVS